MEKNIKFRGKCKNTGEWVYGDLLHIDGGCLIYFGSQMETETPYIGNSSPIAVELFKTEIAVVEPESVGQFTGLLDVKSNEIYEGDIILLSRQSTCIVLWNEEHSAFCIRLKQSSKVGSRPLGNWINYLGRKIEVIGNIHDTPELLNEK